MDDCPECGASCPVRTTSMRSEDNVFICWDCHISWKPPQNDRNGRRAARALPGSVVSAL